jgi:hypothetical protein
MGRPALCSRGGWRAPHLLAGGPTSYAAFEPARYAMGDTLRFAERMNLIQMQPREDLGSTGCALANPGQGCLVLQPSGVAPAPPSGRISLCLPPVVGE